MYMRSLVLKDDTIGDLLVEVGKKLQEHKGEDLTGTIADLWGTILDIDVDCSKMALAMAALKIARINKRYSVRDSYIDAICYLILAFKHDPQAHTLDKFLKKDEVGDVD